MSALLPRDKPFLQTERLELWLPTRADIAAMIEIVSDPHTGKYLGPAGGAADHFMRFQRNAGSWFLHGYGGFIVRERGKPDAIGNCGVFHSWRGLGDDFDDMPEAGWIISAGHEGQGYANEAMAAALDWFDGEHGRPNHSSRVVCMIDPDNAGSIKLAEKLGFAEMRRAALPDGSKVVLFERGSRREAS